MVKIQFFNEVNPLLKGYIRHYWYVNGGEETLSPQKLLPMDHVDLIMTMGDSFIYGENEKEYQPEKVHFHGIREHALQVAQPNNLKALGVSFEPWGFYFFVKQSMNQYVNEIVNLRDVNHLLWDELSHRIFEFDELSGLIKSIETALVKCIHSKSQEQTDCNIIKEFIESDTSNIKAYCEENGISIRKLERIFRKYIGISPKRFMNVVRFEDASRDIIYNMESSLTDISHKHGYYDQPHFVKVFKNYTDYAPKNFQSDKPALKSHFKYR